MTSWLNYWAEDPLLLDNPAQTGKPNVGQPNWQWDEDIDRPMTIGIVG